MTNQSTSASEATRSFLTWKATGGEEVPIRIENLVYTCEITTKLNLNYVARSLRHLGAQLNKKRFAAVIVRYRNPKIAVLLFAQGKIVCTGAKSLSQARYIVYKTIGELEKIGYKDAKICRELSSDGLNIQNMVASVTLPFRVDVSSFAINNSTYCNYEPELFPGVITRYNDIAPITVLVFRSGKMVITGAKSHHDVKNAMDKIYPLILPFAITEKRRKTNMSDPFIKPVAQINSDIRMENVRGRAKEEPKKECFVEKTDTVKLPQVITKKRKEPEPEANEIIYHMPKLNIGNPVNFY